MHSCPYTYTHIYIKDPTVGLVMEMQQQQHWSPQHAMNAYLNTIHLASILRRSSRSSHHNHHHHEDHEPKCMELLSALAAGNGSKLIVQITTPEGITPLTLSLAIAANQTNGRLIIIIPDHHHHYHHQEDLMKDSTEIVRGNPYEIIKEYKKIDFLVVDSAYDDDRLWNKIDVNPNGCLVVVIMTSFRNALFRGKRNYYETINSITLPIGRQGVEVLRIRPRPAMSRRCTRFHVTYEN